LILDCYFNFFFARIRHERFAYSRVLVTDISGMIHMYRLYYPQKDFRDCVTENADDSCTY
jgi:hypothetical protein